MKTVEDPRSPRAKKHEQAAVPTCLVAGYVTGPPYAGASGGASGMKSG